MLFKFINQTCIEPYNDQPLILNGTRYSNIHDETILKSAGYKPKVIDPEPDYNAETQMLTPMYEDGAVITQHWAVTDKPPVPITPPSLEGRVDACEYMLIDMLNFM